MTSRLAVGVALDVKLESDQPDGYLDSNFQVRAPGERFVDLQWGHELYCAGHLIQAAIALHRTAGDDRLLHIARRFADLIVSRFGAEDGRVDRVCGHPEIETALVELYRETGERSYLATAQYFIDRRGHGTLSPDRFGLHYWQDHLPVRDAPSAEGHSVRQLHLDDVVIDTSQQPEAQSTSMLGGVVTISTHAAVRTRSDSAWWPYADTSPAPMPAGPAAPLTAVPYFRRGQPGRGRDAHLDPGRVPSRLKAPAQTKQLRSG